MEEILQLVFDQPWFMRALIASSFVGIMCGVLGAFVVLRNMSLIGDALSHAVLPGVVIGFVVAGGMSLIGIFTGSVIAGIITAVAITYIQQNMSTKNDAAIGIVFTAMFSLGVMGISKISREDGVHLDLKDFLFGNVLGVNDDDLILTGIICLVVLFSVVIFYRHLFITTFQPVVADTMGIPSKWVHYFLMLLLSLAVVASMRTVGVILVVAMLITPAATALLLSKRLYIVIALSGTIGLLCSMLGLFYSVWQNTTPGPAMTVVATVMFLLAAVFSPSKGILFKYIHKAKQRKNLE